MFSRFHKLSIVLAACALCFTYSLSASINLDWHQMTWAGKSNFKKTGDGTLVITRNDSNTSGAWSSQNISAIPGEKYKISAEMASDLSGGAAELAVDFLDKNNRRVISQRLISISGKKVFRKLSAQFTVPEKTDHFCIYAIGQRSRGTVRFRNFQLEQLLSKSSSGIQMVWHQMTWAGKSEFKRLPDGTLTITRNDSNTSGAWGTKTISATPGEVFEISAEMASDLSGGAAELAVDFLDKNNRRVISQRLISISGKKVFRKVSAQFTVPANTAKICFYAIGQHSCGTVKFRNFHLKKLLLPKIAFKSNGLTWRPVSDETFNKYRIADNELIIERKSDELTFGAWLSDPVKVKQSEYYNISSELSGSDMTALSSLNVIFYDSSARRVGSIKTISRIAEQKGFLAENKNIFVPRGAVMMRLQAFLDKGKGTARYRNIKIKKLPTELIFSEYAYNLEDFSTRIGWRSTVPEYQQATVTFRSPGMKDIVIREKESGLTNHSVILPAGSIPRGRTVTAVIAYPQSTKKVSFVSGAIKRIAKSKPFSIPLSVTEPTSESRKVWPVTSGVPFAAGILRDASDVMLLNAAGQVVPAEFYVISRWSDGSVQFLGYTFETATSKDKNIVYTMTNRTAAANNLRPASSPLKKVISSIKGKIFAADGRIFTAVPGKQKFKISRSPACESAEITGNFSGQENFKYRLLLRSYPSGITTVQYNIIGGSRDNLINSIQWEMPALQNPEFSNGKKPGKNFVTLQRDEKNGTGDGFVRDRGANIAIGMQHYREKWPKGIANNDTVLALQVLPPLPDDYVKAENLSAMDIMIKYYWLKDGNYIYRYRLETTGTFTIAPADSSAAWFNAPLVAQAAPEHYCATGVFENIAPRKAGEFDKFEKYMEDGFDKLNDDREKLAQYGWMNFGDWFGERHINWGNNEYDLAYVMALFFARTGDLRYYFRGLEMADHHQSIDSFGFSNKLDRRTKYKHCAGHTGNFFSREDPRLKSVKKQLSYVTAAFDIEGGHNYETGSLLMAGLSGDRYLFNKTVASLEQMAQAFTQEIIFGIERGPGWLMENLVTGMFFTGDPLYRVAAEICLDKVYETQSRENGSMNLPQDVRECDCPDKYSHRGGKPFAVGVMMHSVIRFYNLTGSEKAKLCVSDFARWLIDSAWDPKTALFRYKTGCPARKNGSSIYPLLLDSLWTVGKWKNDPRYTDVILKYAGINFPRVSPLGRGQGVAKHFCMAYRHTPHLFKLLKDDGITDFKVELPQAYIKTLKFRKPAGTVTIEAEDFISQRNGNVHIRVDKIGAEKCFSHWDKKGHSISWRAKNPAGRYKIAMRYSTDKNAARHITAGNTSADVFVESSGGLGDLPSQWLIVTLADKNKNEVVFDLPQNAEITMTNISGTGINPDLFYLMPVRK